ncbi:SDR family NAD(P)-dependent oxidoreductase [Flavilitoribacter nigricans]|uniref:Short-chain dehydrogenase n=1 Tax=Flavilitoribacter nigricans (strain ATCC 23147 / DSM 23189 / NBRC 102662 / NCIMB 1420 / SS-2) TaxID=1122177 RepID=A0A2D0N2I1_FLAN2|nr:SDR family NAD(P)-dependent oxidoreductase [Flavilitoribacter nigricans]PHN02752.1 short-chain dehydrogenase [Flavilitoribacter nigricans DSM 23189 = NBRC 102662]
MKKTILITGSTDGIGKLAALKLAKAGHTIYLHGRNPEKLAGVVAEIKNVSHPDRIGGFVADLSDLNAVREMAKQIKGELAQLDVLINNAGVFKSSNPQNEDGLDMRLVVNYLAPYVLTQDLLPLLQRSEAARLINLSSAAQATISAALLKGETQPNHQEAYAQSKLALTMWSFQLAATRPELDVIAVNPGSLLDTKMVREGFGHSWSPADKGADILYELAVSDTYAGISGRYFDNDRGSFASAHTDAYDQAKIEQLLRSTEELLSGLSL